MESARTEEVVWKTYALVGKAGASLELTTLVNEVLEELQRSATEPDGAAAESLRKEHAEWQKKRGAAPTNHSPKDFSESPDGGNQWDVDMSDPADAAHEPRSGDVNDLVTTRGLDVMHTKGTADIYLSTGAMQPGGITSSGVAPAPGSVVHLHGESAGDGRMTLRSEDIAVSTGGTPVNAGGMASQVEVTTDKRSTKIDVRSFTLQRLQLKLGQ